MCLTPIVLDRLGFLATLATIMWLPVLTMGTFTVTIYTSTFHLGWLGFLGFVGANCAAAIFWNKARKHARTGALLDDRLTSEKMDKAREWWTSRKDTKDS